MATYTAVLAGGNWNVPATWTGGIVGGVPTTGDTAILNATSGPVTVTANALCLVLNCTGYANTLTINTGFSINVSGTGATISLGGTISTLQQGILSTVSATTAVTINFNGVTVPRLSLGLSSGAGAQTVTVNGPTPTVQNLAVSNGASGSVSLANTPLNISTSLVVGLGAGGTASGSIIGVAFNFIGTACSVNCTAGLGVSKIGSGFTVASGCTLTLLSTLQIGGGAVTFSSGSFLAYSGAFALYLNSITDAVTLNTSNVTWYSIIHASTATVSISSDINILTNFSFTSIAACSFIGTAGAPKNINIQGSFSFQQSAGVNMANTIVNLIGTGVWEGVSSISTVIQNTTVNINGTGPYTIGSATRNAFRIESVTINLGATASATVNTGFNLAVTQSTNTINTNNTSTFGSQIIWQNLFVGANSSVTLSQETTFLGNFTHNGLSGSAGVQGAKLLLGGNLTQTLNNLTILGTSTIEFTGSNNVNWGTAGYTSSYQNNITINKSGGTVNLLGTINWGITGRTLLLSSGSSTINAGTSTVTIPVNQFVTISNMIFNNLTITGGNIITQNALNTINSSLLLSGSVTFTGTHGWTTNGFTCTTASAVITLQNANATFGSPLAAYNVTGPLILQGTSTTTRITLQASGRVDFTGGITGSTMTIVSGAIQVGMTVSQRSGLILAGLAPFITDRPVVTTGGGLSWTLNKTLTTPVPAGTLLAAGFKAIFNLTSTGTNVNVGLVTTQDIDSNGGQTILAALSNGDDTATNTALYRTLNWGPLIAPSGSVYYTFVS
jgi:hypothetical protein